MADSRRYSELKPDGIEGNLFQYHSRDLQKQGLIDRAEEGYALTDKGKAFVANLSLTRDMKRRVQPRVITMVIARRADQYLFFRWSRQPYRGRVSFPSGRLGFGEDLYAAAADQLYYKSGYRADLDYLGTVVLQNDADHIIAQVFQATNLTGKHGSDGLTGTSFWSRLEDIPSDEFLSGTTQILDWVQNVERQPLLEVINN